MTEKCCDERLLRVEENLKRISERVAAAALRAGRRPEDVTLLAATKTVPAEVVNHAISKGLRFIGENRVQELLGKYDALDKAGTQIHLIGHLQTNKVRQVIDKVSCIESVDSYRLAAEISKQAEHAGRRMSVLVEVNIGREAQKGGVLPEALRPFLEEISGLSGIQVNGLMAIPPNCGENKALRNYFFQMNQYFIDIAGEKIDNVCMNCLSMGMSSDFEEAVAEGATLVRVGSALFGERFYC